MGLDQMNQKTKSQESGQKCLTCHTSKEKGWHITHHQVKWQKWRNVVVRHKQTLFSSPGMPLLRGSSKDIIAKRNVTAMSYPCLVHLNCRHSIKPRPERSRVSGPRSEEFGDLICLDHGSTKIGDQTVRFLIVLGDPFRKKNL